MASARYLLQCSKLRFLSFGKALFFKRRLVTLPASLLAVNFTFLKPRQILENFNADSRLGTLLLQTNEEILRRDYEAAIITAHTLLNRLTDIYNEGQLTLREFLSKRTVIYSLLANIGLLTGDLQTAEVLFKDCLKNCLTSGFTQDDPICIEILLKLALILEQKGSLDLADLGFRHCLNLHESKILRLKTEKRKMDAEYGENDQALLGMILNYYSQLLYKTGSYEKSLLYAIRAYSISKDLYGEIHSNSISLMSDIAVNLISLNRLNEAEEQMSKAIELCEQHPTEEFIMPLITLYSNMGIVCAINSNGDDAVGRCSNWCEKAEKVANIVAATSEEELEQIASCRRVTSR